jgi:putative membrane protein
MEPDWVPRTISTIFLLAALFLFWSSERRAAAVCRRLEVHKIVELRPGRLRLLTVVMSAATIALIFAIWLLHLEPI